MRLIVEYEGSSGPTMVALEDANVADVLSAAVEDRIKDIATHGLFIIDQAKTGALAIPARAILSVRWHELPAEGRQFYTLA